MEAMIDTLRDEAYAVGRVLSTAQITRAINAAGSLPGARSALELPRKVYVLEPPQLRDYAVPSADDGESITELREALTAADASLLKQYAVWQAARAAAPPDTPEPASGDRLASDDGGASHAPAGGAESTPAEPEPVPKTDPERVPKHRVDAAATRLLSELRMMEWTLMDLEDALLVAARERREAADEQAAARAALEQAAQEEAGKGEASAGGDRTPSPAAAAAGAAATADADSDGRAAAEAAARVASFEGHVADYVQDKRTWVALVREQAAAPRLPGGQPLSTTFNAYSLFDPDQPIPLGVAAKEAARKAAEAAAAEAAAPSQPMGLDGAGGQGSLFGFKCLAPLELSFRAAMLRCLA